MINAGQRAIEITHLNDSTVWRTSFSHFSAESLIARGKFSLPYFTWIFFIYFIVILKYFFSWIKILDWQSVFLFSFQSLKLLFHCLMSFPFLKLSTVVRYLYYCLACNWVFSGSFQHFSLIVVFQQFDHDGPKNGFLGIIHLGFTDLQKSNLCL